MSQQQKPEDDEALPHAKSSGNQGARGSRGQANDGAQSGDPDGAANERAPEADPDLRDANAQGGGGAGSGSSRSR